MDEGELGSMARVAASPHDSSSGSLPKYLHEAALSPTTLPPNGAWEAYMASIFRFLCLSSRRVARIDSMIFSRMVLSFPRDILTTCMVMVLPPEDMCPERMFCTAALAIAAGLTPG